MLHFKSHHQDKSDVALTFQPSTRSPPQGGRWCKTKGADGRLERASTALPRAAKFKLRQGVWGIKLSVCSISLLPWHILFLQGISLSIRKHQTRSEGWNPFNRPFVSYIFFFFASRHLENVIATLSDREVLEIMWHVSLYMVQSSSCHFSGLALNKMRVLSQSAAREVGRSVFCFPRNLSLS